MKSRVQSSVSLRETERFTRGREPLCFFVSGILSRNFTIEQEKNTNGHIHEPD